MPSKGFRRLHDKSPNPGENKQYFKKKCPIKKVELAKEVIESSGNWSKTSVCKVLDVSRFSIYWKGRDNSRMKGYRKKEDTLILQEIQKILKKRASYGYKRVTALINRERDLKNLKNLNRKRIYRIMKRNGLIFPRNAPGRRDEDRHKGRIITFCSDLRWCSDALEVRCFNGETVYVSFVMDCHDRECIAYVARVRPLLARDIQELMLRAVEKRFQGDKAPREIQFLTDRGAIYRSLETIQFGRYLGLKSCFTAPYSPQSNGMSEAFVATLKRDYVYTSDCSDAQTVSKLLKKWVFDYNNEAPHSGLGMKSPVEYRKSVDLGV